MSTMLVKYTTEERRCAFFLWAKGLNAKDIHKEMFPAYSGKCLSRDVVHNWVKKFADYEEVETEERKWLSQKTSLLRVSTHW
jgi:hypothetical protein